MSANKYLGTVGGLGLSAAVWATNQIYKNPPDWLVWSVATAAGIFLLITVYLFFFGEPKPKRSIVDAFLSLITRADELIKEKVTDIPDLVIYELNVKQWVDDADKVLSDEIKQDEVHMFATMLPLYTPDADAETYRALLKNRVEKLRLIMGRYLNSENIK